MTLEGGASSSDELGVVGETLFESLCARAGLICNRSGRDRAGWDFIVEMPQPTGAFDHRWKANCYVQVKATSKTGNVQLTLSSAGLLAMNPSPAVIVVFRFGADREPCSGHVVHLLGKPLAQLLRRMREADAEGEGQRKLNERSITFNHQGHGQGFEVSPMGLRRVLEEVCGPDPIVYVTEKARQLQQLGYEEGGLFAEAYFQADSDEQFTRVLLGLEPMKPTHLEAFDVRFGVPLPFLGDLLGPGGEVTISPMSLGACQVAIMGPALAPAAVFRADMLFAPPIDADLRMLIRHTDFTITVRGREVTFETVEAFSAGRRPLDAMIAMLRALDYFASGSSALLLHDEAGRFGPLHLPVSTPLSGPRLDEVPLLARIAADWHRLLEMAGMRSTALLSLNDLRDARAAQIAADLVLRNGGAFELALQAEAVGAAGESVRALHFNTASIVGEGITYAVEIVLGPKPGDARTYVPIAFHAIDVRWAVADLDLYGCGLAEASGFKVIIHPSNLIYADSEELPSA